MLGGIIMLLNINKTRSEDKNITILTSQKKFSAKKFDMKMHQRADIARRVGGGCVRT
jgi:hypothetical protein